MINFDITIVIVNWNTKDMLMDCINSIVMYNNIDFIRIIVVDNDSSDESAEMVNSMFPFVKVINSGGNIGFAKANNIAISHIDTPFVLFLNPDTLVYSGTIEKMIQFIKTHNEIGLMSCKTKYPEGQSCNIGTDGEVQTLALQWFPTPLTELISILCLTDRNIQRFKKILPYHDPNKSGYVNKIMGTCMMVRKEVLDTIGGFDERFFMYGEDADFCKRISDNGWKLYYMSDVEIAHLCGGSSNNTTKEFSVITKCQSIQKLMEKYYGARGSMLYKLVIFLGSNVRIFGLYIHNITTRLFLKNKQYDNIESIKKYHIMRKWSIRHNNLD